MESQILDVWRVDDVEGREIPERYRAILDGGPPAALGCVVRHNAEDVRSMARLLSLLGATFADPDRRRRLPPADLVALAAAYARDRQPRESLACLQEALSAFPLDGRRDARDRMLEDRALADRARLLRRLGRVEEADRAWADLTMRRGPLACRAWIEVAKVMEHRRRDLPGALRAVERAASLLELGRFAGERHVDLERDLPARRHRLVRRLAGRVVLAGDRHVS